MWQKSSTATNIYIGKKLGLFNFENQNFKELRDSCCIRKKWSLTKEHVKWTHVKYEQEAYMFTWRIKSIHVYANHMWKACKVKLQKAWSRNQDPRLQDLET